MKESNIAIDVISGVLEIVNNWKIYEQEILFRSFLSTIKLSDSSIYDIQVEEFHIEAITSNFTMKNIEICSIQNQQNTDFIRISSESSLTAENITLK